MRDVVVMLWGIYIFVFCVNMGFYFVGNSFSVAAISSRSIDFQELNSTLRTQGGELESGGFNVDLIFGDFGKGATTVWNLFSGGFFLDTLSNIGFSEYFIFPMQAIVIGFLVLGMIIYYISGRQ